MKKAKRVDISLDIGNDSVKMVKGTKSEGRIRVLDFGCRKYSASEDKPDLVSRHIFELLTSAVGEKEIRKVRIHSLISGRKLCVRVVKLPVMPEGELFQAIRSKIRKYVSPNIEQVVFSFFVLGKIQEKGINKLEVVFVAIQKPLFDKYLQLFKLADVQPELVTSSCFSGWSLIREIGLDKGTASLMLINIESQTTDLTVYRENRFVFTRNISIGGRDFVDNMKLKGLLQDEANTLCKEIELTANHYYQITHGRRIDKCIVFGESSQIGGMLDFLKQKLEIPVEGLHIPDAKFQLPIDKREEFKRNLPLYTQALGALLTAPDEINLLANARRKAKGVMGLIKFFAFPKMTTPKNTAPKITAMASVAFMVLGLTIFAFLKGMNLYYQHQTKCYKIRQDKLQGRSLQLMRIKRKMDMLDFQKELYLRLLKEYPAYPVIIAKICEAIPTEFIVLDELRFYGKQQETPSVIKFTILGSVLGKEATSSVITRFVLALEQSGYFENISVNIKEKALLPAARRPAEEELLEEKVKELSFVIDGIVRSQK